MVAPQRPLGSGFGASSTAAEVTDGIDLSGRVAIVTGGHAGIGVGDGAALGGAGATVIVSARDPVGPSAAGRGRGCGVESMDLLDPSSIERFATGSSPRGAPCASLVNNGDHDGAARRDARGYESTGHERPRALQADLGPWPAASAGRAAPAWSTSPVGASPLGAGVWDHPNDERRAYDPSGAYGQSKTGNNLFAVEIEPTGRGRIASGGSTGHPGSIVTRWQAHLGRRSAGLGLVDEAGAPIIDPPGT